MPPEKYADRTLTIYFPEKEEFQELMEAAIAKRLRTSHFAREMIRRGMESETAPRPDLLQESSQAREELSRLRRDLKDKAAAIEKMETELYQLRHQSVLQPSGQDHYSEDLINLLKEGRTWRGADLLKELGVDPQNRIALDIITKQLQNLQDLRLIEESSRGWKWVG